MATSEDTYIHFLGSGALDYGWWGVDEWLGDEKSDWRIRLIERDDDRNPVGLYTLTHKKIMSAVYKIARTVVPYAEGETRKQCKAFLKDVDDADFDAGTADNVIQVALFGEVRYS